MNKLIRIRKCSFGSLVIFGFLLIATAGTLLTDELTLERALNIAFQNSPAMRQASLQLEINERNLFAQQAGLKSQFSLSVSPYFTSSSRVFSELTSNYNTQTLTRSAATFTIRQPIKWTDATLTIRDQFNWNESSSSFVGGEKQTSFSNSLTVSLNQPLFTYNTTKMQITELELALENAQLAYAIQKLQIERQVPAVSQPLLLQEQHPDLPGGIQKCHGHLEKSGKC